VNIKELPKFGREAPTDLENNGGDDLRVVAVKPAMGRFTEDPIQASRVCHLGRFY
jgi:hypothetical protein